MRRVRGLGREVEKRFYEARARRLEIAASFYSPSRGSRTAYHVRKDSWSRIRRAGSSYQAFRRGAASSY